MSDLHQRVTRGLGSRSHWPPPSDDKPPPDRGEPAGHTHPLGELPGIVRVGIVGLIVALTAMAAMVVILTVYTMQFREYVSGRGEYRDEEVQRIEQELQEAVCDVLDTLPVSPLLDQARLEYGCSPGVPLDELPPAAQEMLGRSFSPGEERADRSLERLPVPPTMPPRVDG